MPPVPTETGKLFRPPLLRALAHLGHMEWLLALAEELHADLILVDELAGREVARQCARSIGIPHGRPVQNGIRIRKKLKSSSFRSPPRKIERQLLGQQLGQGNTGSNRLGGPLIELELLGAGIPIPGTPASIGGMPTACPWEVHARRYRGATVSRGREADPVTNSNRAAGRGRGRSCSLPGRPASPSTARRSTPCPLGRNKSAQFRQKSSMLSGRWQCRNCADLFRPTHSLCRVAQLQRERLAQVAQRHRAGVERHRAACRRPAPAGSACPRGDARRAWISWGGLRRGGVSWTVTRPWSTADWIV